MSRLAQSVERKTLNLVVVGSIPTKGTYILFPLGVNKAIITGPLSW